MSNKVFSTEDRIPQGLIDFQDQKIWVAWRNEHRPTLDGKINITKVPYRAPGRQAKSDNPQSWLTLDEAADVAETMLKTSELGGGIGICLGIRDCWLGSDTDTGLRLGGIDLDCCRDRETGVIEAWARTVLDRFNSYCEVSPSGSGVKIFVLYRSLCWEDQLRPLLSGAKTGRQWKRPADHDHPPGIEMYLQCRYFAVTGETDGLPDRLRVAEPEHFRWLVEDYGPRFKGDNAAGNLPLSNAHSRTATKSISRRSASGGHDGSRSGRAFRLMRVMHRMGKDYDEAKNFLLNQTDDPSVAEWAATKGMDKGERELRRAYWNAKPPAGSVDERLSEMARLWAE
jgi:putative DNA primase/helicase